jgi:hypothetical protein
VHMQLRADRLQMEDVPPSNTTLLFPLAYHRSLSYRSNARRPQYYRRCTGSLWVILINRTQHGNSMIHCISTFCPQLLVNSSKPFASQVAASNTFNLVAQVYDQYLNFIMTGENLFSCGIPGSIILSIVLSVVYSPWLLRWVSVTQYIGLL